MNAAAKNYPLESRITSLEWKVKGLEESLAMERKTRERLREMDQENRARERSTNQQIFMLVFPSITIFLVLLSVVARHK